MFRVLLRLDRTKEEMHASNVRMAGPGASAEPSRRLSLPIGDSFCN